MDKGSHLLALALWLAACSSSPTPSSRAQETVRGSVQKGPFVEGSRVDIAAINSAGNPTGATYPTETIDDRGTFTTSGPGAMASIDATGFYYDEISGAISDAPLTLHALVDFGQTSTAIVNVVTHLADRRALTLMQAGMSLSSAESQAETELVAALGIGGPGFVLSAPGRSLDLFGGNTPANAYLLALSAIFVRTARDRPGAGSVTGNLQELLDHASFELAANGTLSVATLVPIRTAESQIDPWIVLENLATRMSLLGVTATLPDINSILDTDHDGVTNSNDNCPLVANPSQQPITNAVCKRRHLSTPVTGPNAWPHQLYGLAAGDFNEDGHLDVVLSGTQSVDQFGFWAGDGAYFHQSSISQVIPEDAPLMALDVNMDHHLDLVALNGRPYAGYFPGAGTGDFGPFVSVGMSFQTSGDLNGDGAPDFLSSNGATLYELLNDGSGHFTSTALPPAFAYSPYFYGISSASIGDVNNDGTRDIIATSGYGMGFAVYLGDGHGSFALQPLQQVVSVGPIGYAIADVNRDGFGDLVATLNSIDLAVSFSAGDGSFGSYQILANNVDSVVATGDITGDGVPDLVYRAATDSFESMARSVMFIPGGVPPFAGPTDLHLPLDPGSYTPIVPADVNGDGRLDLIVPNMLVANDEHKIDVLLLNF